MAWTKTPKYPPQKKCDDCGRLYRGVCTCKRRYADGSVTPAGMLATDPDRQARIRLYRDRAAAGLPTTPNKRPREAVA